MTTTAMMRDVKIVWNDQTLHGDWVLDNGDLALDNALLSAVLVSLFSDGLAPLEPTALDAQVGLITPQDRRGWWGDALRKTPIGSRLWQLKRSIKANQSSVLLEAKDLCFDALSWLVNEGIVGKIAVETSWKSATTLLIKITLTRPNSNAPDLFQFQYAWEGLV
ncbi:phage GP46 family protein [Entomobacter blattae]|uniref:Phage protein GP46 n=1 Tax=Entomobacter blattae TaxID=2762277 RepID=A0A7H1NUJ3_9PROT|nr:phage GP46 family protein [Entomobacter blattae]QNT79453.1 Phage protein GP46 [Entomobacter blattae]